MTISVLSPGLQTTVQAGPRIGMRHQGVPASGAGDLLSLALANRLVGNLSMTPALETTLTGVSLRFDSVAFVAVTGAKAKAYLNGERVKLHKTLPVRADDELVVDVAVAGARNYIAFAGGIICDDVLGSASTYLPAALGGYDGRSLRAHDELKLGGFSIAPDYLRTPKEFRPIPTGSWALRACNGAEIDLLDDEARFSLFDTNFSVGRRADRMGLQLQGSRLDIRSTGRLTSAPVFPGTVQCPEDGQPFMLAVDAQTTGGYARVAQVARLDRHLIGQLRPGDHVRLLWRDPQAAIDDLRSKIDYWSRWLADAGSII